MGSIRNKEYYNKIYKTNKYDMPYQVSEYFELWCKVLGLLYKDDYILEIGCGTGQFAHLLQSTNFKNYIGVDFSIEAINKAISKVPEYGFKCNDIFNVEILMNPQHFLYNKIDLILALETLEHIDDLKFLSILKKGLNIIATVPNFDAPAHAVFFENKEAVFFRYDKLIDIELIEPFDKYFIIKGVVK